MYLRHRYHRLPIRVVIHAGVATGLRFSPPKSARLLAAAPLAPCPLHGASFDIRDGSHGGPPAWEGVWCYKVARVDGEVVVSLEAPHSTDDVSNGLGGVDGMFETR